MTQIRIGHLLDAETLSGTDLWCTSINNRLGFLLSESLKIILTGLFSRTDQELADCELTRQGFVCFGVLLCEAIRLSGVFSLW